MGAASEPNHVGEDLRKVRSPAPYLPDPSPHALSLVLYYIHTEPITNTARMPEISQLKHNAARHITARWS